tara:strand:+ start:399 stop:620 length:222 start_codon:yes stop_codon:yes gene_type:complete
VSPHYGNTPSSFKPSTYKEIRLGIVSKKQRANIERIKKESYKKQQMERVKQAEDKARKNPYVARQKWVRGAFQ